MVMRAMRENTKWIMLIATAAFIAWLVLDWVQSGDMVQGAAANPVVGVVNGQQIHYAEWNQFLERHRQQAREQAQGSMSDERMHQVREQAWEQLVNQTLIEQELARLGLEATDAEIRRAFQTAPPPSLRNNPAFRTDGQFDFQKYRDFFANRNVDQQLLLQIENYYRQTIPRMKLERLVANEVTVTDRELWEYYRDQNETARVRFVSLSPGELVSDDEVEVTDREVREYYEENEEEFSRPATAVADLVTLAAEPSVEDSAAARARLDSLRSVLESGETSFAQLVAEISEDGSGDLRASEFGPVTRDDLIAPLQDAVFSAPVGELVGPVRTPSGFHLLRVDRREGGEAVFSHVLVPVTLSLEAEDDLFDRMDELEGIALRSDLETAADSLGLPLRDDVRLEKGAEFVPGAGALAVAVSWAHESQTRIGDLSQFFENASGYHLLELEERLPSDTRPLEEVRSDIRSRLTVREKERLARQQLEDARQRMRAENLSLEELAAENGWTVREAGPFTRTEFVDGLGRSTAAVGAAFGLEPGRVAGPLAAGGGNLALIELLERNEVTREDFERAKPRLRQQVAGQRERQHIQRWIQALREEAEIRDMRDQLSPGGDQPARTS
jgi:parvulin-like peptidyl-prolyl isomerase